MKIDTIQAVSPIDGRYGNKTAELQDYFSEFALIRSRVYVEIQYFISLCEFGLPQLNNIDSSFLNSLLERFGKFDLADALAIKKIESVTNHDVKAVEYWLKELFDDLNHEHYKEFIHFGLTSQDINNTSNPLLIKEALENVLLPQLSELIHDLKGLSAEWTDIPMLARTHGQPASPTRLGKEMDVFILRLETQLSQLQSLDHSAKFGGATGNLNAHKVAYPDRDWIEFANDFVNEKLGLKRQTITTQIEHYDGLSAIFHALNRISTILIDLCRDIWTYVAMDYFKQKVLKNEVGSSAMPHKVNPIDFENAEGNLGIAIALFDHLANKLPISRLQRDLTDSTVLRNVGVPFGHLLIALKSTKKGLSKLLVNKDKIAQDLENNWAVVAEAIQNILRREGYPKPYEKLKELTRTGGKIDKTAIHSFIQNLDVSDSIRNELLLITPSNYTGY